MKFSRAACASSVRRREVLHAREHLGAERLARLLEAAMLARTASRRASGSAMPTGSGARIAATRLPSSPASLARRARIETGHERAQLESLGAHAALVQEAPQRRPSRPPAGRR